MTKSLYQTRYVPGVGIRTASFLVAKETPKRFVLATALPDRYVPRNPDGGAGGLYGTTRTEAVKKFIDLESQKLDAAMRVVKDCGRRLLESKTELALAEELDQHGDHEKRTGQR